MQTEQGYPTLHLSCLKDLLIKVHQILLTSPMKFCIIITLVKQLKEVFQDFFVYIVRVRIFMETVILSFLTSLYFSRVTLP